VGNLAMGALFGWLFLRWGRRTWPFLLAHALLDVAAGIGFILFRDRLPGF
jgi:membrane protease YdiL (CAAX protease family)